MAINHNNNILANSDQFAKFNILDYLNNLEIIKETQSEIEIYCPVCQAENFKIDKKEGKYYGYSCECMEDPQLRKEIVKRIAPFPQENHLSYSKRPILANKPSPPLPEITDKVTLAQLETIPTDRPQRIAQGQNSRITYHYSESQGVDRIETPNPEKPKGYDKTFRQWHLNETGSKIHKKGDKPWPLYREREITVDNAWPVLVEGEECVESLREMGIQATTFQGSNWGVEVVEDKLRQLKEANVPGLIFIPDPDEAGLKKAKAVLTASAMANFPVIIIDIASLWPEMPDKGDVADWITWGKTNNMYNLDYIRRLEAEMHRAVNERERQRQRQEQEKKNTQFLTEEDQEAKTLEILIKAFIEEKDPFKQAIKRKFFRAMGIGDRQVDKLVRYLTNSSIMPASSRIDASEFRSRVSEGKQWLIPGLIPATGVTLITAPPGGSKSTFMFDLAGSILCGNSFMGESIKENSPVIFACSDEPTDESQERALLQGFIHSNNYEFLENWNISHMGLLEEAIADRKPRAVIIDSFDSIHREAGYDENSPNASEAIKKLNTLSQKYSCAIIVSHHENKDPKLSGVNKARGSSAIVASANAHIRIIGKEDDPECKVVKIEKLRGGATRSILCKVDYYNIRFEPEVNLEFEQDKDKRIALLNFLKSNSGRFFEAQELNEYLSWSGKGIYRYLKQLTDRGEISRKPNLAGRKGMTYGFLCTNTLETDALLDNLVTPPSLEIESKEKKEEIETLDVKGIEHNYTPVTTESQSVTPQSQLVTTESQGTIAETAETLTLSDSHTCDQKEGNNGGGEMVTSPVHGTVLPENQQIASETEEEVQPQDWNEIIKEMDTHIEQLGWSKEQARKYVQATYGKKSRLKLTDGELLELLNYLKVLVKAKE
jgi:hypothetical protein